MLYPGPQCSSPVLRMLPARWRWRKGRFNHPGIPHCLDLHPQQAGLQLPHTELDSRQRVTVSDLPKVTLQLRGSAANSSKVSCSPLQPPRLPGETERCRVHVSSLTDSLAPATSPKTSNLLGCVFCPPCHGAESIEPPQPP